MRTRHCPGRINHGASTKADTTPWISIVIVTGEFPLLNLTDRGEQVMRVALSYRLDWHVGWGGFATECQGRWGVRQAPVCRTSVLAERMGLQVVGTCGFFPTFCET